MQNWHKSLTSNPQAIFSLLASRFSLLLILLMLFSATIVAEENTNRYIEFGEPGSLGFRKKPGSFPLEVRAHETSAGPAIDILSRAGVARKVQIPAVRIHNYGYGPGLQIDQVGPNAGIIVKQASNGNRMPESMGQVSNSAFIGFVRASEPGFKGQTITVFDRLGNLRFEKDSRQRERSIRIVGSDFRLRVDKEKVIIAEQPIVIPRVTTLQNGRMIGALGMLDRQLSVWNGEKWAKLQNVGQTNQPLVLPRITGNESGLLYGSIGMLNRIVSIWNGEKWLPLQFQRREGRRKHYTRYILIATIGFAGGLAGALVLLITLNQFPWLKRFTRLLHPTT